MAGRLPRIYGCIPQGGPYIRSEDHKEFAGGGDFGRGAPSSLCTPELLWETQVPPTSCRPTAELLCKKSRSEGRLEGPGRLLLQAQSWGQAVEGWGKAGPGQLPAVLQHARLEVEFCWRVCPTLGLRSGILGVG